MIGSADGLAPACASTDAAAGGAATGADAAGALDKAAIEAPAGEVCRLLHEPQPTTATAATEAGYGDCYNILEGFEGDKDAHGHRNTIGGWRKAGLPWIQG